MKPSLGIVFIFCVVGASIVSAAVLSSQPELTYTKAVYSLPLTYDPTEMNDEASLIASSLIYDGLLAFTPALRIEGALAESWKTSRDGKTLTFKLRSSVQFHNGEKLNATTVVRSLERAVRPGSTVFKLYDCIQGADEYFSGKSKNVRGLKALDDLTVQIELKNPFPPFMSVLAGATAKILPSSVFTNAEFFKKPIGTGPFKFEQINKTEKPEVVLVRNEFYPLKPAKIEKLILREISEVDAQLQAKSGLIQDLSSYPLKGTEDVFNSGQKVTVSTAATWIIGLSSKLKPFDSLAIREKFRSSVDVEAFRKRFHPTSLFRPT